ncbi:hypothetical protein CERSUDRAFT_110267 [Gelatoporia subvermispora B]|uniref:C3H1-type domain-containing protein n=1 Tax=Ceriporiopsis subvermispora (strain B) TaxID=914234 RepID=M2RB67_CERS8|nr:hypothetical protein CERSUDRAFT_110267 [Gelatoporia subvermispora B]
MLTERDNVTHLKPWLIRTLEPICDAEPGALADYILALLNHDAPESELRRELAEQLDEFLEKEGPAFLDTLFTALRTKSYLPYSAADAPAYPSSSTPPVDPGIPIPLDLLTPASPPSPERGRKRGLEDDADSRPPAKGPRLQGDGQVSRFGRSDRGSWNSRGGRMAINGRGDYMDGAIDESMAMNGAMGMNGRGAYRPPERRGICRDYHNNGYCARGAFCKYSHGDDAVIPAQLYPMGGPMPMPMMGMMSGGMPFSIPSGSGAAYDPRERMDMRPMSGAIGGRSPHPRAPIIPRQGDINGSTTQKPGELPVIQDLTPQVPKEDVAMQSGLSDGYVMTTGGLPETNGDVIMKGVSIAQQDGEMTRPLPTIPQGMRGGHRGPRGGGRGTFGGDAHTFRPEKRNGKTLVVEKIPDDKLSLGSVNEWFKRFGTVTNVAVDAVQKKALVSFANHEEALAAWKSEDAVFGNRFVKVFWHRPMEGHGQLGARMLAASAPMVANIAAKEATPAVPPLASAPSAPLVPPTTSHSRAPSSSLAAAALAAKQRLLEQQIAEQKSLMAQLATVSPQEKKTIMARLRKLGEEMKPSDPSARPPTPSSATSAAPASTSRGVTPRAEDRERLERERLDKELELHHAATAADGEAEESTEELRARLAKLKAEAASLGLPEASDVPHAASSYRPYRGRGRGGRSFYRGAMRGGPPRTSMKLDLRPKKLLVKGVNSGAVQAVRDWYETTGHLESVETLDDSDVVVSFRTRAAAEQGLAKGAHIATIGPVQISWYANQQHATAVTPRTHSSAPEATSATEEKTSFDARPASPVDADDTTFHEEMAVSGWGGDDDGFGML